MAAYFVADLPIHSFSSAWASWGAAWAHSPHPVRPERVFTRRTEYRRPETGSRTGNPFVAGGAGAGSPLPLLVPQVDADGNERAGIRLPEVAVPLATYTGWNFRSAATGGTNQLVPLLGSYIPLARTKAEREARHDPRPSIEERYTSRQQYLDAINKSAAALVKEGYLLAGDVPSVVKRAAEHWEFATHDAQN